jgi:hypothetical protein
VPTPAIALERPSSQLAPVVPVVVTPSQVAIVVIVAAVPGLTAKARKSAYLNIGILLSLRHYATCLGGLTPMAIGMFPKARDYLPIFLLTLL